MEFLGNGSFGSVYKINDSTAMKCQISHSSLKKEFEIAKDLSTLLPNDDQIIKVYNYNGRTKCYTMEFLSNYKSLDNIKLHKISQENKSSIMKQLRFIINDLHSLGYAHHDIALRNIMYNQETDNVKLIDFGLAHNKATSSCLRKDLSMLVKVEKLLLH
jgi:RIO-like serine/threonine protein kinase